MEEERCRSGESATPSEDDLRQQEAFERLARPDEDITTIVRIGSVLERKVAALACHDSQMRGRRWDDPETRAQLEAMFGAETFVRVDPRAAARRGGGSFRGVGMGGAVTGRAPSRCRVAPSRRERPRPPPRPATG